MGRQLLAGSALTALLASYIGTLQRQEGSAHHEGEGRISSAPKRMESAVRQGAPVHTNATTGGVAGDEGGTIINLFLQRCCACTVQGCMSGSLAWIISKACCMLLGTE